MDLLIGRKPIKPYVSAAIFELRKGAKELTIKARGRSVSKAVDLAEILKRFTDPVLTVKSIAIGTQEFDSNYADKKTPAEGDKPRMRRVSTIEIEMSVKA